METKQIKAGHVYRGRDGTTRKVEYVGRGREQRVRYRSAQQSAGMVPLARFAEWAAQDITGQLGRTQLVGRTS